jgi:hypothetical protein
MFREFLVHDNENGRCDPCEDNGLIICCLTCFRDPF